MGYLFSPTEKSRVSPAFFPSFPATRVPSTPIEAATPST